MKIKYCSIQNTFHDIYTYLLKQNFSSLFKGIFFIKHIYLIIFTTLFFLPHYIYTEEESLTRNFKVGIFNFSVDNNVNIKKFAKKINLNRIPGVEEYSTLKHGIGEENYLGWKFSVIYRRVQRLLNMYPVKTSELKVNIYKDLKDISHFLKGEAAGKSPEIFNKRAPAFYNIKNNTLYLSHQNFDEYIFAHEIAHVIISSYFAVEPPPKVHELLAMYCDKHLKDSSQ